MVTTEQVLAALEAVKDPEIPVISIVELGLVADVRIGADGVRVALTPTFAGCPAVEVMRAEAERQLRALGAPAAVTLTFDPPWDSDRISAAGRRKLQEFGLAPPPRKAGPADLITLLMADCPYCGSADTRLESAFGPTLCRAIYYCDGCRQSFEQFKPL
jgi:ring-1,2-phenylacetyl-CoA epoxidase subunit PaaD